MRYLRRIGAMLGLAAALCGAKPAFAAGTVILANGGKHFSVYGPATNWRFDWGRGYCGTVGTCGGPPPTYVHWTYVHQAMGSMNGAYWNNPYPVWYPSYASAFIPSRNATATVTYSIKYAGLNYDMVTVNQLPYYNQWVRLNSTGRTSIERVHLGDQTWWGSASDKVAFDEIKIEN